MHAAPYYSPITLHVSVSTTHTDMGKKEILSTLSCQTRFMLLLSVALERPIEIDVRTGFKGALYQRCP